MQKENNGLQQLEVLKVQHWTSSTFSFSCVRPENFRFRSGEFVMIGLNLADKPLLRAYSIASPNWHEEFEFYSIKVEDGPLTSKLQQLKEGDNIEVLFHADKGMPLSAQVPSHVILKITFTEPGIKGNTATNATKPATTESGAIINVPLFINEGDKIKIDTTTKSYIERIKE